MRQRRYLLPWILTSAAVLAQTPENRPYPKPGAAPLLLAGHPSRVIVTPVTSRTVRITVSALDAMGTPPPFPDDPAIVARRWAAPALETRSIAPRMSVKAGALTIEARTDAGVDLRILDAGSKVVQQLKVDPDAGRLVFQLGAGPLFGLGQGGIQYDRRGNRHLMRPGSVNMALNGMRVPVPWLISPEGWALFVNRPAGEFDLTGTEGVYVPLKEETRPFFDVFISISPEPAALMREYAELTGLPTMPPLWTLGYQQSHRTVWDRNHVFDIARTLREKKLPCDVLIYLGTGWCPSGWNEWHGSFDFNKKVFPDPAKDIRDLQSMNYKVSLHVVGIPVRLYGTARDPVAPVEDLNQVAQYWKLHQPISRMIDAWWPDVGEDVDDAGRLARIRMYWEGPQLDHPNVRPYALHRTGYAGMQRYGGWLWSGDVDSTWAALKNHIAIGVNTGLSGVPYWGTDVAGFFSTAELTGDLFVRWFQFSAFSPLFRSHGRPSSTRLPWGWNTGKIDAPELDPGRVNPGPDELRNPLVEPICRKYLELRYRLMPYLYSLVRETAETGIPIMRPIWMHYPESAASTRADQYLWGRDILVAPVVEKGATSRSVYLPTGDWYDFWTNEKLAGGREITRKVDLETIPLYVRAGAVIPFGPVRQYTAEKSDEPLTLRIYPGASSGMDLYEDDGMSFNFEKGDFLKVRCTWDDGARSLSLDRTGGSRQPSVQLRRVTVEIAGSSSRRSASFNGKNLTARF